MMGRAWPGRAERREGRGAWPASQPAIPAAPCRARAPAETCAVPSPAAAASAQPSSTPAVPECRSGCFAAVIGGRPVQRVGGRPVQRDSGRPGLLQRAERLAGERLEILGEVPGRGELAE